MSKGDVIEIPVSTSDGVFTASKEAPVRGGGSRLVPLVPTPLGNCPCIWRSHEVTAGSKGQPVYNGILLVSKDPPQTVPFEIDVAVAKNPSAFPLVAVEW